MLRKNGWLHTYTNKHTHAHTHTHKLFLKTGFLASRGLKTSLYAKKSKFYQKQWCLYEEPILNFC